MKETKNQAVAKVVSEIIKRSPREGWCLQRYTNELKLAKELIDEADKQGLFKPDTHERNEMSNRILNSSKKDPKGENKDAKND